MKLVTTDADTYVVSNAAGYGVGAMLMLLPLAPIIGPFVLIAQITFRGISALQNSVSLHPALAILLGVAVLMISFKSIVWLLRKTPPVVLVFGMMIWFAACYGVGGYMSTERDWMWGALAAVIGCFVGRWAGNSISNRLHHA